MSEEEHKSHFENIVNMESQYGVSFSSFDFMPALFNGIQTSSFGYSSSKKKNPFFKLVEISKDEKLSWEDRTQAIRYMQRIPHLERSKYCIDSTIHLILDKRFPLRNRYHFFSNNEKIIKLDYDIVNACHDFYFNNHESFNGPIIYRILSAQYLLTQFPIGTYDSDKVQKFLYEIAVDKDTEIHHRAECADILSRVGYYEYREMGDKVLDELGSMFKSEKDSLFTIYANAQNVHDKTITKKLIESIQYLSSIITPTKHSGEVFEVLKKELDKEKYNEKRETVLSSFQRVIIDTSKYEGLSLCDIMLMVWEKMIQSKDFDFLLERFIEELSEMDGSCSSGHVSRLLNVLSGFFDDIKPVQISYEEQLRSNIFGRYTNLLRTTDEIFREQVFGEMSEEKPLTEKSACMEFVNYSNLREELEKEFIEGGYLTGEVFDVVYKKAENDFFGCKEEKKLEKINEE